MPPCCLTAMIHCWHFTTIRSYNHTAIRPDYCSTLLPLHLTTLPPHYHVVLRPHNLTTMLPLWYTSLFTWFLTTIPLQQMERHWKQASSMTDIANSCKYERNLLSMTTTKQGTCVWNQIKLFKSNSEAQRCNAQQHWTAWPQHISPLVRIADDCAN